MPSIELLNYGRPSIESIRKAFKDDFNANFPNEEGLVTAIKLHLMSQSDLRIIQQENSSIEAMLNGRVLGDDRWVAAMFERWNAILDFKCFGS